MLKVIAGVIAYCAVFGVAWQIFRVGDDPDEDLYGSGPDDV